MSSITISTPFNIDLEFKIAPFHKRMLAWAIDIILIYSYVLLVIQFLVRPLAMDEKLGTVATILLVVIPAYSYHLLMEIFMNGRSIGKLIMGLKVMDITGKEPSFYQYLLRWLFRLFDMVLTFGAGAVLAAALSKNSQRIGDMVAGTIIIDQSAKTQINDTIYLELNEEEYVPVFPEVMHLSDRDINGIRNLLDIKGTNQDTEIYMEQVAQRIKEVLKIHPELEPRELLEQLLKDYNLLTR